MDGKKFDKNTLKTLVIAASLLLNCVLGGASYTYYHHLAEQMNETASLQSQISHLEGSVSDLQAQADESRFESAGGFAHRGEERPADAGGHAHEPEGGFTETGGYAQSRCVERLVLRRFLE